MPNGASTVAPTSAGSGVVVFSVRSTPSGANRYGVKNGEDNVDTASRIHQKFQANAMLSPAGPGSVVDKCVASGQRSTTASTTNASAARIVCRARLPDRESLGASAWFLIKPAQFPDTERDEP